MLDISRWVARLLQAQRICTALSCTPSTASGLGKPVNATVFVSIHANALHLG
ncbi:MAG: hypothetical protein RMI89_04960 [Gloeomargarita sp. SKYBB_i_bin120]|nr:hypothetical protein [Gloeomargarita sp. SKYG98]MCS7292312.1 hypothetical protein [Gloeomargarita sp. SKYB120]MDW8177872.1 hypothetical protein [Gloeomargarita sp. SKYBB_i_bin120]